jgi:hypothetical protein
MIYIQLIGLLAFCILVLSFYKKDTKTILVYQTTSNLIYFIHYLLLGGLTGAFISLMSVIRNIVFIKTKSKIIIPIFILLYLIITIIFYESIYSILPMIANSCYLIFITFNTKKHLLIGEVMSATLWVIYSIFVLSYTEIITESILIVSNVIQLIRLRNKKS